MDFWPAGAIMAEDQVDGWLAGDGREMAGVRPKWALLPLLVQDQPPSRQHHQNADAFLVLLMLARW